MIVQSLIYESVFLQVLFFKEIFSVLENFHGYRFPLKKESWLLVWRFMLLENQMVIKVCSYYFNYFGVMFYFYAPFSGGI